MKSKQKKNIVLLASILLLTTAVIGAGTLAYVTARVETTNVITTGEVELKIVETKMDDDGNEVPYPQTTINGIVPGAVVSKIPRLKNVGRSETWMRARPVIQIVSQDGLQELKSSVITLDFNSSFWKMGEDGWYYYVDPVVSGARTEPLFTQVSFSGEMDNIYTGANVAIEVVGESVQTKNNAKISGNVLEAKGWPSDTK